MWIGEKLNHENRVYYFYQAQDNLRNVHGAFVMEGMTISKDTHRNLDCIGNSQ